MPRKGSCKLGKAYEPYRGTILFANGLPVPEATLLVHGSRHTECERRYTKANGSHFICKEYPQCLPQQPI